MSDPLVWIVRRCRPEVRVHPEPVPYSEALAALRQMAPGTVAGLDLEYVETGRLASWVL